MTTNIDPTDPHALARVGEVAGAEILDAQQQVRALEADRAAASLEGVGIKLDEIERRLSAARTKLERAELRRAEATRRAEEARAAAVAANQARAMAELRAEWRLRAVQLKGVDRTIENLRTLLQGLAVSRQKIAALLGQAGLMDRRSAFKSEVQTALRERVLYAIEPAESGAPRPNGRRTGALVETETTLAQRLGIDLQETER